MNTHMIELIITIICAVFASSGFWAYLQFRREKNDVRTRMLIGLGHDRIMDLGKMYLNRTPRYITTDEYENLTKYLYEPYHELGGNGSAERIMDEINTLPIRDHG